MPAARVQRFQVARSARSFPISVMARPPPGNSGAEEPMTRALSLSLVASLFLFGCNSSVDRGPETPPTGGATGSAGAGGTTGTGGTTTQTGGTGGTSTPADGTGGTTTPTGGTGGTVTPT